MGINFPSTPAEGQVLNVSPGKSFVFKSGLWRKAPMTTAMPKNYIVNPCDADQPGERRHSGVHSWVGKLVLRRSMVRYLERVHRVFFKFS